MRWSFVDLWVKIMSLNLLCCDSCIYQVEILWRLFIQVALVQAFHPEELASFFSTLPCLLFLRWSKVEPDVKLIIHSQVWKMTCPLLELNPGPLISKADAVSLSLPAPVTLALLLDKIKNVSTSKRCSFILFIKYSLFFLHIIVNRVIVRWIDFLFLPLEVCFNWPAWGKLHGAGQSCSPNVFLQEARQRWSIQSFQRRWWIRHLNFPVYPKIEIRLTREKIWN